MGEQLQNIQNAAVSVWVDTQNELEYMERVLEERKNSVYMSKQKTSSESSAPFMNKGWNIWSSGRRIPEKM